MLPTPSPSLTRTDVCATVDRTRNAQGKAMETVHIYRLKDPDRRMKAARVWMYCIKRHTASRSQQALWPTRDDLQREQEEAVQSILLSRYPRYAGAITDFVTYCHATEKNIVPKSSAFAYVVLMGLPACRKAAVGMVRTPLDVAPVRYSVGIH